MHYTQDSKIEWNKGRESLRTDDIKHLPNGSKFHQILKTVLFRLAGVGSASE